MLLSFFQYHFFLWSFRVRWYMREIALVVCRNDIFEIRLWGLFGLHSPLKCVPLGNVWIFVIYEDLEYYFGLLVCEWTYDTSYYWKESISSLSLYVDLVSYIDSSNALNLDVFMVFSHKGTFMNLFLKYMLKRCAPMVSIILVQRILVNRNPIYWWCTIMLQTILYIYIYYFDTYVAFLYFFFCFLHVIFS